MKTVYQIEEQIIRTSKKTGKEYKQWLFVGWGELESGGEVKGDYYIIPAKKHTGKQRWKLSTKTTY